MILPVRNPLSRSDWRRCSSKTRETQHWKQGSCPQRGVNGVPSIRVKKTVVTEPGEQPDLIGAGQGDQQEKEDLSTELDCRLWLPPLQKRLPSLALFFFKFILFIFGHTLENPMDRGAWWVTVHRVAKSRTRLSDYTHLWHVEP